MWAASRNGNLSVAQHLLACGADTELQDHVSSPYMMACIHTLLLQYVYHHSVYLSITGQVDCTDANKPVWAHRHC